MNRWVKCRLSGKKQLVALSCTTPPASLHAPGNSQHHPQPTNHLSVSRAMHVFPQQTFSSFLMFSPPAAQQTWTSRAIGKQGLKQQGLRDHQETFRLMEKSIALLPRRLIILLKNKVLEVSSFTVRI